MIRNFIDIIENASDWKSRLGEDVSVVWEEGEYAITVDSLVNAKYVSLWYKGVAIGRITTKTYKRGEENYTEVSSANIDFPKHKGLGLGKEMYRALLKHISTAGIISYLPDRVNKRAVPAIYRSLGAHEDGDWAIIKKPLSQEGGFPTISLQSE